MRLVLSFVFCLVLLSSCCSPARADLLNVLSPTLNSEEQLNSNAASSPVVAVVDGAEALVSIMETLSSEADLSRTDTSANSFSLRSTFREALDLQNRRNIWADALQKTKQGLQNLGNKLDKVGQEIKQDLTKAVDKAVTKVMNGVQNNGIPRRATDIPGSPRMNTLFLHGRGEKTSPTQIKDQMWYWGKMHELAAPLGKNYFMHTETVRRRWDDITLLTEVCTQIVKLKIDVIVTHSMGCMVMAAIISLSEKKHPQLPANCKKIKFAKRDSKDGKGLLWIASGAPFRGSPLGDACNAVCAEKFPVFKPLVFASPLCGCNKRKPAGATASLATTYQSPLKVTYDDLSEMGKQYAFRRTCGYSTEATAIGPDDALGLLPLAFDAVSQFHKLDPKAGWGADAKLSAKNQHPITGVDGMVAFSSCRGNDADAAFGFDPASVLYAGRFNHGSQTYRDADGSDPDMQPGQNYVHSLTAAKKLKNDHKSFGTTVV